MDVQVRIIDTEKYNKAVSDFKGKLPLWLRPEFIDCYRKHTILIAEKGTQVMGVWVIPFTTRGNKKTARREYRFFPYSSPFILTKDNLIRRKITNILFTSLIDLCDEINLPFDPSFRDLSIIQGLGGYVEWRHTHHLSKPLVLEQMTGRLRNHIINAKKQMKIDISENPSDFNFDIAIQGSAEEKKLRKNLALKLLASKNAIIIIAKNPDVCGGILVAFDDNCAYMVHSWQKEVVPRGTISALIFDAVNWVFAHSLCQFDFEGSVLQSIDYFFSGFNGDIIPYGHLFWSKNKEGLYDLINKSMNISGRLII